jgi:hypothetical protein
MNCRILCTMFPIWISGKGGVFLLYTPGLPILDITKRSVKTMKIHFTVAELYKKPKGNPVFNNILPHKFSSFPFIFLWHFFPYLHYTFADSPSTKFSGQTWRTGRERASDAWTMGLRDKQLIALRREGWVYDAAQSYPSPRSAVQYARCLRNRLLPRLLPAFVRLYVTSRHIPINRSFGWIMEIILVWYPALSSNVKHLVDSERILSPVAALLIP